MPDFAAGKHGEEYAALMAGAEREPAFVIAFRHRADRTIPHTLMMVGRIIMPSRIDAASMLLPLPPKSVADDGHDDHQSEEAVDHRGNARQQVHGGLEDAV